MARFERGAHSRPSSLSCSLADAPNSSQHCRLLHLHSSPPQPRYVWRAQLLLLPHADTRPLPAGRPARGQRWTPASSAWGGGVEPAAVCSPLSLPHAAGVRVGRPHRRAPQQGSGCLDPATLVRQVMACADARYKAARGPAGCCPSPAGHRLHLGIPCIGFVAVHRQLARVDVLSLRAAQRARRRAYFAGTGVQQPEVGSAHACGPL